MAFSELDRDHTLNGGVVFGIDGRPVEIQARAVKVLNKPAPWPHAVHISGMAGPVIKEAMARITGAFAKLRVPEPQVDILVNLAPADLIKDGTWLDLPLAVISSKMRAQVERARELQHKRFGTEEIPHNAAIPGGRVLEYCQFSKEAMNRYKTVVEGNSLSTRSMDRLAKVARTIADLESENCVEAAHIEEATEFITGGALLTRF